MLNLLCDVLSSGQIRARFALRGVPETVLNLLCDVLSSGQIRARFALRGVPETVLNLLCDVLSTVARLGHAFPLRGVAEALLRVGHGGLRAEAI